jgi:hypothetical protein
LRVLVLCLALFLPLAQTVAMVHSLLHVQVAAAKQSDFRSASATEHCSICSSAQTVMGGAPLLEATGFTALVASSVSASLHVAHQPYTHPIRAYRSRAPPVVLN